MMAYEDSESARESFGKFIYKLYLPNLSTKFIYQVLVNLSTNSNVKPKHLSGNVKLS